MESNHRTWESRDVVLRYSRHTSLQRPEATIFALLRDDLHRMRVLDVGVGAGRTTRHLAHAVGEYVGLDYSANMIAACRRTFAPQAKATFRVGDVRELSFASEVFDLVLVSYNSLDYIDHHSRLKALRQIHRVLAPGGYVVLSAHNIRSLSPAPLSLQTLRRPLRALARTIRYAQIRLLDRRLSMKRRAEHAVVRDLLRLQTYYVRPEAQMRQLRDVGFDDTRAFSLDGQELVDGQIAERVDKWIYFMSRRGRS
jgi:ubiquinone/menaquinone biosynthesis C-methylase UbiE